MNTYSELCSKSCFSFLQGASHPEELVKRAFELGYKALALNDLHGFYGMVRAYEEAKQLSFPVIFGTEISLENSSLCFLAKNISGYRRLCRLISEAFELGQKNKAHFRRDQIENWFSPSDLFLFIPPRDFPSEDLFNWLRNRFPIYQFVTRKFHPNADQSMKKWLEFLPPEIPRVWTWDVWYHHPERFELLNVLHSIRENIPISKRKGNFNAESYLKPLSELKRLNVPSKWIKITNEIAEECLFSPSQIRYSYPQEYLPPDKNPHEFLKELCKKGLEKRFPGGATADVLKQLDHELKIVKELNYEDYFLTVWDVVQFARSKNILCQGRGSAANSVICYLLEITSIDPVKMNLLFERFISKERNEAPDIDIDFEHERREEVIQYIYQKYGRHRAAMVATLITYRTKAAIRDIGKALEIPAHQIAALSKQSRWRENIFELKTEDHKIERLLKLVKQIRGFPRHLGQHTGGMILCQDRLDEISPIEPASMPGRSVVQWDKYNIEKLGLLKIDFLSLGMLTCIRKSFELLKKHRIAQLELHSIPADDEKTYQMINESQTLGVFQIESRAQMSMLPRLQSKNFYDLVVEVAIVRPGPIQGGMVHPYLKRRMGLEKVEYAHPLLKPILEKTMGIPIFQEQVMKMAIEVAGYTPGEADALRRAMGAWKKQGNLKKFAEDIYQRLYARGVPMEFAQRICKQILGFGEYGFPESHAASFALLTYTSSYLKAHYPYAFLCALLNSMPMGFYPIHVLTSGFLREGVSILPVHLEKSEWDHTLEKREETWHVRLGFRCVRSLKKSHVEEYISRRSQDPRAFDVFDKNEKASLAMIRESQKRMYYWKALQPKALSLPLGQEKDISFKEPDPMQSILLDFEFMETSLRTHPVKLAKEKYWAYDLPINKLSLSEELCTARDNAYVFVFGMLQVVQSPPTAKGMFFITLEDETGFLNLVLKPQIWKKWKHLIQDKWMILAAGKLQKTQNYHSILVNRIFSPVKKPASVYFLDDLKSKPAYPSKPSPAPESLFYETRLFNGY